MRSAAIAPKGSRGGSSGATAAGTTPNCSPSLTRIGSPRGNRNRLPLHADLLAPTPLGPFAALFGEDFLAEPDLGRGDLDELVGLGVLEGQFQGQLARRLEQDVLVGPGGPDVGQLLLLARIDD